MNDLSLSYPAGSHGKEARRPWYHWRRLGFNFLTISLIVHLLIGVGAAYLIVQTIQAKRRQTFTGPAPGPSAPARALEHKVKMQQKRQTMSAPAPLRRITTTSMTKIALPALPAMPKLDTAVMPLSMAGMGGTGVGLSMGGGGGGSGGGGGGLNLFGIRGGGKGLAGTFYDLKQTAARQPTGMTPPLYTKKIEEFVRAGFSDAVLAPYFKAPEKLYTTQIFTPSIPASLGPAAFNLEKIVQPRMWCVHYKGTVRAPESGTFRFCGMGDDLMLVKFDNREVLDACWFVDTNLQGQEHYKMHFHEPRKGFTMGVPFTVEADKSYPIEVVIGEQPGGESCAILQIEKVGQTYQKAPDGDPLLPIFRMANNARLAPSESPYAPHAEGGPVWLATPGGAPAPDSIFDH